MGPKKMVRLNRKGSYLCLNCNKRHYWGNIYEILSRKVVLKFEDL